MNSRPLDPEEAAVLAVFAELGRMPGGESTRVTSAEDDVEEVLRRLDLETFGLLAWGLDRVPPAPAIRERLLERLSGDSTQEVLPVAPVAAEGEPWSGPEAGDETVAVMPAPAAPPAAEAPARARPNAARAQDLSDTMSAFPARHAARRRRPWAGVLAAVFALAAIGLGGAAAWLYSELASGQARIARLEAEVARLGREHAAERTALAAQVAELEQRRAFAAGTASAAFALRAPVGSPQPLARGKLWLAADHRHWQLEVTGLAPTPAGREYQVWFVVEERPTSGGCFAVEAGRTGALGSATMPSATTEVRITLERAGGSPAPTSPILLVGDQAVEL